jgi:hypothetical protein
MLQLPSSGSGRRFTKAQIADISRGAMIRVRNPKPDPVVSMVAKYAALNESLVEIAAMSAEAKERLPEEDRGWFYMSPPEELRNVFGYEFKFRFSSLSHVRSKFREMRANRRRQIKKSKALIRRNKGKSLFPEIELELAGFQHELSLLLGLQPAFEKTFIREKSRFSRVQKKAGLTEARAASRAAILKLSRLSEKINKAKPQTVDGALAMIQYAEIRIQRDGQFDDGDDVTVIVRRARTFLSSQFRRLASS